jgi:hypothetical protein
MNDTTPGSDPPLEAWLSDVVADVEADLVVDGGCPDLAAVVALAHRIDPVAVPETAVAEVQGWAPVVTIGEGRRRRETRDDPEFAGLLGDVRASVEQDVMRRIGAASPVAESQPTSADDTAMSGRRIWSSVLAVAAVLVLVGGGILTGVLATRDSSPLAPHEAVLQDTPGDSAPSTSRPPAPSARTSALPVVDEDLAPVVVDELAPPVVEEPTPSDVAPRRRVPARKVAAPRSPAPGNEAEPTLDELDAAARAAWREGDRDTAQKLFRRVIERAGRGRLADLAYGDLLSLARQAKSPGREVALWREYLGKFPDGRFADDARAGLCRRTSDDDARRACWSAYLDASPDGAHRRHAAQELGEGTTP